MIKNKWNNALLSILLLVPGHICCFEQHVSQVPQGILERLYLSLPSAPAWMTSFTTNMTSGFLGLSDKTKYLIYGAMAALVGYVGYRAIFPSSSSMTTPVTKSIDGTMLWLRDFTQLYAFANCDNMVTIIKDYKPGTKDEVREAACKHYICPVLEKFQNQLDSEAKWQKFLPKAFKNRFGIDMPETLQYYGAKLLWLINVTCPNSKITEPLKSYLRKNQKDQRILEILNGQQ